VCVGWVTGFLNWPHLANNVWLSLGLLQGHRQVCGEKSALLQDVTMADRADGASYHASALWVCVLVADLTCGALISQRTTSLEPHPPQTLTGPGEAN